MRSIWLGLYVGLTLMIPSALPAASQVQLEKGCIPEQYGFTDTGELARFDTELRQALKHKNLLQLSALVNFPLRVNGGGRGAFLINDPRALKNYYELAFPAEVRARILNARPEDISCMGDGVMYDSGVMWVKPVALGSGAYSYRVNVINLPGPDDYSSDRLDFICETPHHRIVIDTVSQSLRYRVWNKPRALTAAPDLELAGGIDDYQGRGVCGHSLWRFVNGTTSYALHKSGGCGPYDRMHILGEVEIAIKGKVVQTLECR